MTEAVLSRNTDATVRREGLAAPKAQSCLRYLNPDQYPVWDALVDAAAQGSVFTYSWWLQAVGNTRVLGYFENDRLVAGIPLYSENKFGFTLCRMPPRCPAWGVVMAPIEGKSVNVATREIELLRIFAKHLAGQKIFFHLFPRSSQNWLPFYWNGFRQTARFTYVIDDIKNLDEVWDGLAHNIRGEIRKAERRGLEVRPCSVADVSEAEVKTFGRQHMHQPSSEGYLERLFAAAAQHSSGECFAAVDADGRIHAANMVVWDRRTTYFFAGGADPELRTSGATSLLVWKLIQFAAERSSSFDFCGSVVPQIERFFRAFGGRQVPCHAIMKFPLWMRVVLAAKGKI